MFNPASARPIPQGFYTPNPVRTNASTPEGGQIPLAPDQPLPTTGNLFDRRKPLWERGVSALGIDTLSPDRPEDGFPVHRLFLGADKIIIENVAHLDSMPPAGSFVMVLPMKIKDGTEAPVRLVGLLP